MPVVAREGPYRFFFYSHEPNEPPHVHVQRDRGLAKFWLAPLGLASSTNFSAHELRRIRMIIERRTEEFLEVWHDWFDE
ncbi:MAG: DUF4160 domain-containing protein [Pirellulaceae bacterium]|nr:DUF4160 domain-containing protein [Pirellulaceae bacterium]